MKLTKIISGIAALLLMGSCGYDDFISDYEYSATYFASQQPLRTIVAEGDRDFEVGVTLAGLREDNGTDWVNFEIDTVLLDSLPEAANLVLLPDSYYILGDESTFNISKTFLRTVNVQLTDAFFNDPLSLTNHYALPLRIVESSLDSILGYNVDETTIISSAEQENMDVTIVVVKYVSPYSGTYYSKGVQYKLDAEGGTPIDTVSYTLDELSLNKTVVFTTLGVDEVETAEIAGDISGAINLDLSTGSLVVTSDDVTNLQMNEASYDDGTFTLDYTFETFGSFYKVEEQLIQRQAVSLDLRFEEWE